MAQDVSSRQRRDRPAPVSPFVLSAIFRNLSADVKEDDMEGGGFQSMFRVRTCRILSRSCEKGSPTSIKLSIGPLLISAESTLSATRVRPSKNIRPDAAPTSSASNAPSTRLRHPILPLRDFRPYLKIINEYNTRL